MATTLSSLQKVNIPLIKAKFPSVCTLTGLRINAGDLVFYNPDTKKVFKAVKVYRKEDFSSLLSVNSWLYQLVERIFDRWIESASMDHQEMYFEALEEFNGGTYYSKRGAIRAGIELIFEAIEDEGVEWAWLHQIDIEAAFE